MSDTGIFWIRDDFRIENNPALSFAKDNAGLFSILKSSLIQKIPVSDI